MNVTASDRASLLRLAASLPVGDESRRAILSGLKKASPETDQFWKNFSKVEWMSYRLGSAVAFLLDGKIDDRRKAWLEGTANRAHAQRALVCKALQKETDELPEVVPLLPLLKLCQAAASASSKAQTWSPSYEGDSIEKVVKKLTPLYQKARSQYPAAAHLLDDNE